VTQGAREVTFAYDDDGNLESVTDMDERTTSYDYDEVGRVTEITRPDSSTVGFTYDVDGNLTTLTTPSSVEHDFGYNDINRNTSYTTPLSGSYAYAYDKGKRLTTTTFPSTATITNVYSSGRLTQIQTPGGNVNLSYVCGSQLDIVSKGSVPETTWPVAYSSIIRRNVAGCVDTSVISGPLPMSGGAKSGVTVVVKVRISPVAGSSRPFSLRLLSDYSQPLPLPLGYGSKTGNLRISRKALSSASSPRISLRV